MPAKSIHVATNGIISFFFCFGLVFFFWPHRAACRILVPQRGIKPTPPAVEAQSLNGWTAREVPADKHLTQSTSEFYKGKLELGMWKFHLLKVIQPRLHTDPKFLTTFPRSEDHQVKWVTHIKTLKSNNLHLSHYVTDRRKYLKIIQTITSKYFNSDNSF